MNFTDKTILNEDNRYVVIEEVDFDGKKYVFISNPQDKNDSRFVEVEEVDGNVIMHPIDPSLFKENILPLFIEKFETYQQMKEESSSKDLLLTKDLQNEFINNHTKLLVNKTKNLLQGNSFDFVAFTRFINSTNNPTFTRLG